MLVCDNCGSQIIEGAKFCPNCADPVTVNDFVGSPQMDRKELTCPRCQRQSVYDVSTQHSRHDLRCPKCKNTFSTRIVKIRAKNARGNKKYGTREFSVRVVDASGSEELIEFFNDSYKNFELRSKDDAAFSYVGKKLTLVENLTVERHMKLRSRGGSCLRTMLTLLFIALILACVVVFLLWRQGDLGMYPLLEPLENILPPPPTGN